MWLPYKKALALDDAGAAHCQERMAGCAPVRVSVNASPYYGSSIAVTTQEGNSTFYWPASLNKRQQLMFPACR